MNRQLITTADGSHTVLVPEWNVTYHSRHGAVQESQHIFIAAGLQPLLQQQRPCIRIFEMGFGTGLNALLSFAAAAAAQQNIHYTAAEAYPLDAAEALPLNYCNQLQRPDLSSIFQQLHQCAWNQPQQLASFFTIEKINSTLQAITLPPVDLIYYDAFAPSAQPELWTTGIFAKIFAATAPGGVLVTYCSKSDVRRALQLAGFRVEKLAGPPGKREMVRAWKEHEAI
jgi:tRNA U34 5-methylaminomethyl-2-thiouridine-forming methyltransferase MnmC